MKFTERLSPQNFIGSVRGGKGIKVEDSLKGGVAKMKNPRGN
jgi:hypothetical protein